MLKTFALIVTELLTNQSNYSDDFYALDVDTELKCILNECYFAEVKTQKLESDSKPSKADLNRIRKRNLQFPK
jgi:hypothetical protein